jgi:hypothetical protein
MTSRIGNDAPRPKHFVIATMGSSKRFTVLRLAPLIQRLRSAPLGKASRYHRKASTRWEVSMNKAIRLVLATVILLGTAVAANAQTIPITL